MCLLEDFSPKYSMFFLSLLLMGGHLNCVPYSEPTVFENYVHDIFVDEQMVELSLWDTAGMLERYLVLPLDS